MKVQDDLRQRFLGWQCRIRQHAMRKNEGRPSAGMCPRIVTGAGQEIAAAVTTLLIPEEPAESTDFFRHQVRKSHDPRQVYERGLAYLQATHFQDSSGFSDRLTAIFPPDSQIAAALLASGECILEFAQFSQQFRMFCTLEALPRDDAAFEASLWHNRIFNPATSDDVIIVAFSPDWKSAQAVPST